MEQRVKPLYPRARTYKTNFVYNVSQTDAIRILLTSTHFIWDFIHLKETLEKWLKKLSVFQLFYNGVEICKVFITSVKFEWFA